MNTTTTILVSLMLATTTLGLATAGTITKDSSCGKDHHIRIVVDNSDDGGFVSGDWGCGGVSAACSSTTGFCDDTSNAPTGYSATTSCTGQAYNGKPSLSCSSFSRNTNDDYKSGGGGQGNTCDDVENSNKCLTKTFESQQRGGTPTNIVDAVDLHTSNDHEVDIFINGDKFGAICTHGTCLPVQPVCTITDGLHTCSVVLDG